MRWFGARNSMNEDEACKTHIQDTPNAFCILPYAEALAGAAMLRLFPFSREEMVSQRHWRQRPRSFRVTRRRQPPAPGAGFEEVFGAPPDSGYGAGIRSMRATQIPVSGQVRPFPYAPPGFRIIWFARTYLKRETRHRNAGPARPPGRDARAEID